MVIIKDYIGHCIELLCNDSFRNEIKKLRNTWVDRFNKNNKQLELDIPVDFHSKRIEYLWQVEELKIPVYKKDEEDEIYGHIKFENILELYKENDTSIYNEDFKIIRGFKDKSTNTKVCLTIDNVKKEEKEVICEMLNRWGLNASYINPVFSIKDRFVAYQTHPFYCFISVCVVFKMDSIHGENMKNLIPPSYFWLVNFKDILIEYMIRNKIFYDILDKLRDPSYSKKDILKRINSKELKNEIREFEDEIWKYPDVYSFLGGLPSKGELAKLWQLFEKTDVVDKKERFDYIKAYDTYLQRKNKTFEEIADEDNSVETNYLKKRITRLRKRLDIPRPKELDS